MCHYVQALFLRTIWSFVTWRNNIRACFSSRVLRTDDGRASCPFSLPAFTRFLFARHQPTCFVLFDLNNLLSGKRLPVISSSDSRASWVLRRPIIPQLFNWSRADRLAKWRMHFWPTRSKFGLAKLWLGRRKPSVFWKTCKQVLSRAECTVVLTPLLLVSVRRASPTFCEKTIIKKIWYLALPSSEVLLPWANTNYEQKQV